MTKRRRALVGVAVVGVGAVVTLAGRSPPPEVVSAAKPQLAAPLDPGCAGDRPIIVLEEEVEVTSDVPTGGENLSAKNLDATPPHGLRAELADLVRQAEPLRPVPTPAPTAAPAPVEASATEPVKQVSRAEGPERADHLALRWLARHQSSDGSWSVRDWARSCGDAACASAPAERADPRRDLGATSLALLAFLNPGHTHRVGSFKQTVARALQWLKSAQLERGAFCVGPGSPDAVTLDDHALGTMALCETYAISRDFTLKRACRRALEHVLATQGADGGWSLGETGAPAVLRTARMAYALKTGLTAGLDVPAPALERAGAWVRDRMRPSDLRANDGWRAAAGLGIVARVFGCERRSTPDLRECARVLATNLPADGSPSAWFEGTLAALQLGGATWKAWFPAVRVALERAQRTEGCVDGSWDPGAEAFGAGGRVEATALGAMTLDTYSRYPGAGEE